MQKPFRMEICMRLLDDKPRTTLNLIDEMKEEYKDEKQLDAMESHLQALRAVGIIAVSKEWVEKVENKETLIQQWVITDSGRKRLNAML